MHLEVWKILKSCLLVHVQGLVSNKLTWVISFYYYFILNVHSSHFTTKGSANVDCQNACHIFLPPCRQVWLLETFRKREREQSLLGSNFGLVVMITLDCSVKRGVV